MDELRSIAILADIPLEELMLWSRNVCFTKAVACYWRKGIASTDLNICDEGILWKFEDGVTPIENSSCMHVNTGRWKGISHFRLSWKQTSKKIFDVEEKILHRNPRRC